MDLRKCGAVELPPENVFVVGWWQREIRDGRNKRKAERSQGKELRGPVRTKR